MTKAQRWLMRAPIVVYRLGLGRLLTRRMLLLTHTGRKSGLSRSTMLEVVEAPDGCPVVVSGFGRASDWYKNVTANPAVDVNWAGKRFEALAHELDEGSAAEVFDRYRTNHPRAAAVLGRRLGLPLDAAPEVVAAKLPVLRLEPAKQHHR